MTTNDDNHPPTPANQLLANACKVVQTAVDVGGLVLAWWIATRH